MITHKKEKSMDLMIRLRNSPKNQGEKDKEMQGGREQINSSEED